MSSGEVHVNISACNNARQAKQEGRLVTTNKRSFIAFYQVHQVLIITFYHFVKCNHELS